MPVIKFISKFILTVVILLYLQNTNADNWQVGHLTINNNHGLLEIKAKSLSTPFIENHLSNIEYNCQSSQQIYPLHQCENGFLNFGYEGATYRFLISGWFNLAENSWDVNISNTNNSIAINLNSVDKEKVIIKVTQMPMAEMSQLLKRFVDVNTESTTAKITAEIEVNINKGIVVKADYKISEFSWESEDEAYIFADSQLHGKVNMRQTVSGLDLSITTKIDHGEGLFKDVYILFDDYSIDIKSYISFNNEMELLKTNIELSATDDVQFAIDVVNWQQNKIHITYDINNLTVLYKGFMASYLEIVGINDVDVTGQSQGRIVMENGKITDLSAEFKNLNLEIESIKTSIQELNASINWRNSGKLQKSQFNWQKLLLAGMPINQSKLQLFSASQQLQLQEDTVIPIFDGSVVIYKLELSDLFKPQISINFDGEVKPISLALITKKMGWPLMNGSISGKIPGMRKQGQSITFDGSLNLTVFDGQMQIDDLSIERLFGVAPVIAADIKFYKLNLQQITSTFDFGEMTGLIDGYVNDLRITNWKADRLDAYIESSKSSKVKQTISQRAIDNISSIGGIQGALSRSFLRFFEYFKYKRIGIGCKLRNSICEMRGIETNSNSYYIIEGKGIPSINIIGISKFIDWQVFLDRLLNAGY